LIDLHVKLFSSIQHLGTRTRFKSSTAPHRTSDPTSISFNARTRDHAGSVDFVSRVRVARYWGFVQGDGLPDRGGFRPAGQRIVDRDAAALSSNVCEIFPVLENRER